MGSLNDAGIALDKQREAEQNAKRAVPRMLVNVLEESPLTDDELIEIITKATNMLNERSRKREQAAYSTPAYEGKTAGPDIDTRPEQVQGVSPSLHRSTSGATSSHVPLRYDLIPRALIDCTAARYTMGVAIHTERGYQKGLADRDFIINRINHTQEHWNKLFHPTSSDDKEPPFNHIGAILWGMGFILEVMHHETGNKVLHEIIANGRVVR